MSLQPTPSSSGSSWYKSEVVDDEENQAEKTPRPSSHTLRDAEANVKANEKQREPPDAEKRPPTTPPFDPSQFPDGGLKAWLTVFGAFWCLFCSFGWIYCTGVFQSYYSSHQLREYSQSTIAWIPSLETCLMFFGGPFIGKVFDSYGPRWILIVGTFFHIFGLMMTSISREYYQILLAQGICSPIGASCIFYAASSSTSTWFLKRRGLALGIMAAGASLGGVILPLAVDRLLPEVGFEWTIRIIAFILLFLMVLANLTLRSRVHPEPKPVVISEFLTPFQEFPFLMVTMGSFLFFFGLFLPYNYITVQTNADGVSKGLSNGLLPIMNATSLIGRICPGYLADRFGRFNVMIITCVFTAITVLVIWIPSSSTAPFVVFAALYGLGSGAFIPLVPAVIAQISDIRKIGVRSGSLFCVISIACLIGSPVAGALLTKWKGNYRGMEIFTGIILMGGALFFIFARVALAGPKLTAKI